jgi:hypothetical protein
MIRVLKDSAVVSSMMGGNPTDAIQTLVKTAELRGDGINPITGNIDPDRLASAVHQEVATIVAGCGLIKPGDLLQLVQQARPAARMYADAATFWQNMTTPLMDMGGRRSGTADTAFARQLFGGKMSLASADQMSNDGLLNKGMYRRAGTGVVIDDGAVVGEDISKGAGGLRAWVQSVICCRALPNRASPPLTPLSKNYTKCSAPRRPGAWRGCTRPARRRSKSMLVCSVRLPGRTCTAMSWATDLGANTAGLSSALGGLMQL